jgi:hypothetical protein
MTNQRKQIIVNEIAFWKQNKMLPEHYCDFLTSLYTGGDTERSPLTPDAKQSVIAKEKKLKMRKFIVFPILTIISLILLNFISVDWLAITIGLVLGIIVAIYGIKLAINNHVAAPILHVSGALLLLTMSVKIATTYYDGSNAVLFGALGINCALWLLLGIWQKLIYFILAGGLGIALIVTYSLII